MISIENNDFVPLEAESPIFMQSIAILTSEKLANLFFGDVVDLCSLAKKSLDAAEASCR